MVAIAAGWGYSLALEGNGTVVAWGDNSYGECDLPNGLSNVTTIAAGGAHGVALKSDGSVVAWGANLDPNGEYTKQAIVPVGLNNVTAIAAGYLHSVALKSDGTVVAWGAGQTSTNTAFNYGQSDVPSGLSNVVAIAAGFYHTLALKSDGTVVAWGAGSPGNLGAFSHNQSTIPEGLSGVMAIAAGGWHSLALVKSDAAAAALRLQAQLFGSRIVLSWPNPAQSFVLQTTTNVGDANSWKSVPNVPILVNLEYVVTNQIVGGMHFYRLSPGP